MSDTRKRRHVGFVLAVVLLASAFRSILAHPRLGLSPQIQSTHECFLFARLGETTPDVSDAAECGLATAPASTFKIPHALIALQTGVITTDTVIKWDGTPYEFDAWRRDHTLSSAIKSSVRPFFEQTARLIGSQRMHEGLSSLAYAADTFDGNIPAFWVTGDLVVSPMEQFTFLQRFFAGTLPLEVRHMSAVKEAMRMPPGQILLGAGPRSFALRWPKDTIVRAKTGNTTVKGERVSWLMGALESNGVQYVFVARARSKAGLENTAGAEVARRGLNAHVPKDR
jgi:beta-lactamase class D